jgi:type II secretory pathway pseudopilin PulG
MKSIIKNQKGIAFIETMIALVILGLIGTAFMVALSVSSKAIITSDELTISESLARSQLEYIKRQDYAQADGGEGVYLKVGNIPAGYTIWSVDSSSAVVVAIVGVPWDSQTGAAAGSDSGLQKIRLVIQHNGQEVYTMEGYKVDR